jgi:hypothetical protein
MKALDMLRRYWPDSSFWTAAATIAIALATLVYTHYSRKQWEAMNGQLGAMRDQLAESREQNLLTRQQLEGTMSAVVGFEEPRLTPDPLTTEPILLIQLVNHGHIIAPEAHASVEINTVSFPEPTTVFESKADTLTSQQLAPGGNSVKQYSLRDFLQRDRNFITQRKTVTVQGTVGFDNGFGHKFEQPVCYSYIGRFNFKNEGAGSTSGGDGFYPCDRFKELVPYILKHPLPP